MASPPAPSLAPAPVLSSYENGSRTVARDDGLSVQLPNGNDLWIFGDTAIYNTDQSGKTELTAFIPGGSGAEGPSGPGQIPTSLMEVPRPGQPLSLSASHPPALYMPAPTNIYLPDGSGRQCASAPGRYPARWPSGAALIPRTSEVLVTYVDVCVAGWLQFDVEGWGFMEYNWQTNGLDLGPDDVFPPSPSGAALSPERQLGSPVITDGRVALFSFNCTVLYVSCLAGQTYFTTVLDTPAVLSNPASYSVAPATTDHTTLWRPAGIAVARYPDAPLRMIEMTGIAGTYEVLTATNAAGPWRLETSGAVPGCQALRSGFCYSFVGHPELSSPSQLMISYYDPGAGSVGPSGPVGHLVGAATSYGGLPVGAGSAPPPLFEPSNPHPAGPPRPVPDGPFAGQPASSPQCCPTGPAGAVHPGAAGAVQGGRSQGPAVRDLNEAYQSDRPPHVVPTVRLGEERLDSSARALELVLGGLSTLLIVTALRRTGEVMTSKQDVLALGIPLTRTRRRPRT